MEGADATPLESLFAMRAIGYHTIVPREAFQGLRPWTPPKGLIPLESLFAMRVIGYHTIVPRGRLLGLRHANITQRRTGLFPFKPIVLHWLDEWTSRPNEFVDIYHNG